MVLSKSHEAALVHVLLSVLCTLMGRLFDWCSVMASLSVVGAMGHF